jgi:hypothetical protein
MTAPAAGWYRDPAGGSAWRWWDGASWTGHVRAADTGPVPVAAVPETGPTQVTPEQAGPEQVGPAASIPQPGEVAGPPVAASGGQVSMTVDIPVTDQMYWHSGAAEVIEIPRLPHQTVSGGFGGGPRKVPGFVRDWQDLGSPNTPGIWLLAAMPLMSIPLGFVLGVVFSIAGVPEQIAGLVGSGVGLGLNWTFAALDQRALAQRGYHAPSVWWMLLLPPLCYFIARGKSVRRESMRAWPPELLYVGSLLLLMAAALALAFAVGALSGRLPAFG